ncbi:MAG: trypsin-like peptidase domain-containing protein [Dehalococcoidales bacterium]|nr:trypsin-like peptidase domain-containing protein [Dehalococcoidales bacterium]
MNIKRWVLPIISLFLILSLVLTAGCQLLQTSGNTSTTAAAITTTTTVTQSSSNGLSLSVGSGQPLSSIAEVVARVKPSVVAINVKATVTVYDIFGRAYSQEQEGAGSGWIISGDGLIVTNTHVIEGASSIMVTLDDGRSLPVDIDSVKADAFTDLAVMKVDATNLPAVTIGDSDKLREGDWVVAIGNSLGEGIRVTQGIVSRKNVLVTDDTGQEISGLIETDAVINPGNSGGPLVNMAGEVVGITNAKKVIAGVEGVGYAISINEAVPIVQTLIAQGYIVRPYLGISTETMNDSYAFWYQLHVSQGALITGVGSGSPAEEAGLQVKDIIVKFNGQDIITSAQLTKAIQQAEIGQEVEIVYWRGSSQYTTKATLIETPNPQS